MGAMKYISIFIFITFVFGYVMRSCYDSKLDGVWNIEDGSEKIALIRINRKESYIKFSKKISNEYNIAGYVPLTFYRTALGVALYHKTFDSNGKLKLNVYLNLRYINTKNSLILSSDSHLILCKQGRCDLHKDIHLNVYSLGSNFFRKLIDIFV